eukprot:PITA_14430
MMIEGVILGHYISAARIQEFDITIKDCPGTENLVADFLSRIPKLNDPLAVDDQFLDEHLFFVAMKMPWYANVGNYLAVGKLPKHLTTRERKLIVQCNARFSWIGKYLFHTWADMCIHRCIREDEIHDILKACHDESYGGHFAYRRTRHKVLQMGYYWPTIFKDAKKYAQACDSCQRMGRPGQSNEMPLQPQLVIESFEHWTLDFVGPFHLSSNQKAYILVATNYVTKWVETIDLPRAIEEVMINFLFGLFVQYGLLREVITDGGKQFTWHKITATLINHHITQDHFFVSPASEQAGRKHQ